MSKLSLFFDKKKKPLKVTPLPEKEEKAVDFFFGEIENEGEEEWTLQKTENPASDNKAKNADGAAAGDGSAAEDGDGGSMSWMKVSVIDTMPTSREEKKTWAAAETEEEEEGEEEKTAPADEAPKTWVPRCVLKQQGKVITDRDPTLAASLTAFSTSKKNDSTTSKRDKKEKEKDKEKSARERTHGDDPNTSSPLIPKFNIWDFVHLDLTKIGGLNINQDDQAVLQKYKDRVRIHLTPTAA